MFPLRPSFPFWVPSLPCGVGTVIDGFAQLSLGREKKEEKKECLVFTGAQNRTERLRIRKEHIQREDLEEKKRVK